MAESKHILSGDPHPPIHYFYLLSGLCYTGQMCVIIFGMQSNMCNTTPSLKKKTNDPNHYNEAFLFFSSHLTSRFLTEWLLVLEPDTNYNPVSNYYEINICFPFKFYCITGWYLLTVNFKWKHFFSSFVSLSKGFQFLPCSLYLLCSFLMQFEAYGSFLMYCRYMGRWVSK